MRMRKKKKVKKVCIACSGTGISSRGWPCYPCKGKGFLPIKRGSGVVSHFCQKSGA